MGRTATVDDRSARGPTTDRYASKPRTGRAKNRSVLGDVFRRGVDGGPSGQIPSNLFALPVIIAITRQPIGVFTRIWFIAVDCEDPPWVIETCRKSSAVDTSSITTWNVDQSGSTRQSAWNSSPKCLRAPSRVRITVPELIQRKSGESVRSPLTRVRSCAFCAATNLTAVALISSLGAARAEPIASIARPASKKRITAEYLCVTYHPWTTSIPAGP